MQINIGKIGEYLVLADLLLKGIKAFPTTEKTHYDIVAEIKGRLIKLQVKTTLGLKILTKCKNPVYNFDLRKGGIKNHRKYQLADCDGFAFVALDTKRVFYSPFVDKTQICIRDKRKKYSSNGNKKTLLYFQDLTWENLLKSIKSV